ncbi:MAG: ABC transporter ATP-binding protein [Nitrososphaerales archaeon]
MAKILEVKNLNVFRGPLQVLRDVSISVEEGEIVAIVGRNGAGKTSLIKSIMGLLPVKSGKIFFKGKDITNLPTHERAKMGIGYLPDDMGIIPDLTVSEMIKTGLWVSGISMDEIKKRVTELFPEIKDLFNRRGLYLSGGEKRMAAISRALALNPTFLLLDEALEGLAPIAVSRFIGTMKELKKIGLSLFAAESNVVLASRMADKLYAIERGEIIYEGDPKKIFEHEELMRIIRG